MTLRTPALNDTPRLLHFVTQLDDLLHRTSNEADILERGKVLLAQLIKQDDWLPEAYAQAHPERYQQFLLYADPDDRFSVVSFVWGPGQSTPIHDHTVWGLIGMLRGAELTQPFAKNSDGQWQASGEKMRLEPGQVEAVSPTVGDVHRVWNALPDQASISIHVYGANIGKVKRHVFHEDGTVKEFISGYSNELAVQASEFPLRTFLEIRQQLLQRQEIAIVDVREEDPFAQAHPLFAANMPLGRIEVDAYRRIPRRDTPIVVYGINPEGEDLALPAARLFQRLGYTQVSLLAGDLKGWQDGGGGLLAQVVVDLWKTLVSAFHQFLSCQSPTDGAVAQSAHRVGNARVDERLRANDAACAPRTVDDDAGGDFGCQGTRAQHQFSTRHAHAFGNAHGLVFVKPTRVKHHHIGVAVNQRFDFLC